MPGPTGRMQPPILIVDRPNDPDELKILAQTYVNLCDIEEALAFEHLQDPTILERLTATRRRIGTYTYARWMTEGHLPIS